MTVIFLPDYTDGNPYQANLADALDEEVALAGSEGILPILNAVRSNKDVSVVHVHWLDAYIFNPSSRSKTLLHTILTIAQLLIINLKNTPVVWTVHNLVSHESTYPWLERLFKHIIVRYICDALFVHCEAVTAEIVAEYKLPDSICNKIHVINHGHYLNNYNDAISTEQARNELGLDQDKRIFLYFGQIRPYKGVPKLIEEFKSIESPDSLLLVVGSPAGDSLERAVRNKSTTDSRIRTILEFIPDNDIQIYMNAADCVVLPYNKITTSGSAVLAASFGKAIIIPRLGCVAEQLDEEGSVIYSPDNKNGLRSALVESLERNLSVMGEHNKQLARQRDWDGIANTTSQVYRKLQ
jgi:glycosyltransferase involved in cell wall biosynthesis